MTGGVDSAPAQAVTTYKRAAARLLGQEVAAEQVRGFWSALSDESALNDFEVAHPLLEAHMAAGGAGAVTGSVEPADLAPWLKLVLPRWKRVFGWKRGAKERPRGAPAAIIITQSAQRCCALANSLGIFKSRIAKLFAKHLSIEDQHLILKGAPVTLACGEIGARWK